MKKILIILSVLAGFLFMTSCTCTNQSNSVPFVWNVTATAQGEGTLSVTFPTGGLTLTGNAEFEVASSNDTTTAVKVYSLPEALNSNDENVVAFANQVDSAFDVNTLEGTWHVDIVGYAKQPDTGIYIVIDKHWPVAETSFGFEE